jgi:hypothetical protein
LRTDSVFNRYFLEAAGHYFRSKGHQITGHDLGEKVELSADSLASIASRFFYANRLEPNGKTEWNICVGKNGYRNNPGHDMVPLIEAFCFMAIFEHLDPDKYGIYADFRDNAMKLKDEYTGRDDEEKLMYFRASMYEMMARSDNLKRLLRDHYTLKKEMLNFTVV